MTIAPTRDIGFLRRWMLRSAFVRKMGGIPEGLDIDSAFEALLSADARFIGVWEGADEKGCVIFVRNEGAWELHLCLATWWRTTRRVLGYAMDLVCKSGDRVVARFPDDRRSINKLLDDVGFPTGFVQDGWRTRVLTF